MKKLRTLTKLFFLLVFFAGAGMNAQAQTSEALFKDISVAIRTGNAGALSSHFNNTVQVTLPDVDESFSSKQATFVLKDFFVAHPPKSFKVLHKGESGSTYYETCEYRATDGLFDTNIFVKKIGTKLLITQISFEKL